MKYYDVIIIGGGAAGFFAAINIAESNPQLSVAILEKNKAGLQKVKVSGGGRCNVTHAEFIPSQLVQQYPRGEKELLGPFHTFMTGDTIAWFSNRGVTLKIEDDGRMFPVTDTSQTIIDCFLNEASKLQIDVLYSQNVQDISVLDTQEVFQINTKATVFNCKKLLVATGSSVKFWKLMAQLGHTLIPPVPSLFTFHISDTRIKTIPGVVAQDVEVKILKTGLVTSGPLLITHWGMSGPAILKLSAFGAVELAKCDYKFEIEINFVKRDIDGCIEVLKTVKQDFGKKLVCKTPQFELPKRLWQQLVLASAIGLETRWADVNKAVLNRLARQLTQAAFKVEGKSTFKEEFVTAGGIDLKEVNFKTFESKCIPNLYFAGEVLNIDAVTGGFNFQNAWTSAYMAAQSISKNECL